jgi:hypothetical protein
MRSSSSLIDAIVVLSEVEVEEIKREPARNLP